MFRRISLTHKSIMSILLGTVLLASAIVYPDPVPVQAAVFVHPGLLNTQTSLERMRDIANADSFSAMNQGYSKMTEDRHAKTSYAQQAYAVVDAVAAGSSSSEIRFRDDAQAVYAMALEWVKTGNSTYLNKSKQILNDWASTFTQMTSTSTVQPALEASWALPIWVNAAEIIRHFGNGSGGWSSSEIAAFESFVRKVMTYVDGPYSNVPNWRASIALARMSAGVFLNDTTIYNRGLGNMEDEINIIGSDGTPPENTRDLPHSQANIIATAQGAETAYNQGDSSLFLQGASSTQMPLLWRQSEYYVKELMGTGGAVNYSSDVATLNRFGDPPYEILLSRYKHTFNMPIPDTENWVLQANRPNYMGESYFINWLTATHAAVPAKVFVNVNYTGTSAELPAGAYTLSQLLALGIPNDSISSIMVSPGYRLIGYQNYDFSGTSSTFNSDDDSLVDDGYNDEWSSIKVEVIPPRVYTDVNYSGNSIELPIGTYTMSQLIARGIANDSISSLRVPYGFRVTGYANDNFTGDVMVFTQNDSTLVDNGFNDKLSSIRVEPL